MPHQRFDRYRFTGLWPIQQETTVSKNEDLQKSMEAAAGDKPVKVGSGLTPKKKPGLGNVAASLSPKSHKSVTKGVIINDEFDHDTAFHMAFIGAGQGGSRIANAFWRLGYRRVGIFNTTDSDFEGIEEEIPKLSLDIGGAAKDMLFARQALETRDEEVWDLMQRAWGNSLDCALVCVGLGGGSGSGTGLPLVRLARQYMETKQRPPRVGAVVSLPSIDEGQQVARNAVNAFKELLADRVSPLLIIDNDRVHQLYEPPMSQLLPKSNELVSQLFHLFNTLAATKSEHITFDRAEFAQLLDGGIVVMGSADIPVDEVRTPADVSGKIRDELANSVLAEVDLRRGKKAACVFVASPEVLDSFGKDYFAAGFTQLNRIVGAGHPEGTSTVVHRGLYRGADEGLQCYTMISELDPPYQKLQALAKEAGLSLGHGSSIAKYLGVE